MKTNVTLIEQYKDFGRCVCISDGTVELFVSVDIGPRIMRCGFVGGENIMFNDDEHIEITYNEKLEEHYYKGANWVNYGGHRLWVAPESMPETYYPDNKPVKFEIIENGAKFLPEEQVENGVKIALTVTLENGVFSIDHFVTNTSPNTKTMSCWSLTVLGKGGVEVIPNNTVDTGLLPNRIIAAWPYTNLQDHRLYMGKDYITLKQDPEYDKNFKLGLDNRAGKALYIIGDTMFINSYDHESGAEYEDFGCSFETYTNLNILEMETLGRKHDVKSGETISHTERWRLEKAPESFDVRDDEAIAKAVGRYLK